MRILLDECVDWRLSRAIVGHEVMAARQMGWSAVKNGELLSLAAQHFDVFLTVDQSVQYQQNIRNLTIAVVIVRSKTNRLADLLPVVPSLLRVLKEAKRGTVSVVGNL